MQKCIFYFISLNSYQVLSGWVGSPNARFLVDLMMMWHPHHPTPPQHWFNGPMQEKHAIPPQNENDIARSCEETDGNTNKSTTIHWT